jgi:hypothetical protein
VRRFAPIIVCTILVVSGSLAQSQRARERGHPPIQTPSTQQTEPTTPDKRGTEELPLSIKILPGNDAKDKAAKEENNRQEKSAIDKKLAEETSRLADKTKDLAEETGWLAIFSAALVGVALFQAGLFWVQLRLLSDESRNSRITAEAARDNANTADRALKTTQRAFVYKKQTNVVAVIYPAGTSVVEWSLTPDWENSGTTPTKRGLSHVSWKRFPTGVGPESIDFADQWGANVRRDRSRVFIAPKGSIWGQTVSIPVADLLLPNQSCFVWGWVDYDDIFDIRHRTEFCIEIELRGDPAVNNFNNLGLRYYRLHNGSDDECYRQPSPFAQP